MGRIGIYEYPEIGIDEAVKIAEQIALEFHSFELEQEDVDDNEVLERLAKILGHKSSKSGRLRDKITALKRYGLLDEENMPTELANKVFSPAAEDDLQFALVEIRDNIELFDKLVQAKIDLANDTEAKLVVQHITQAGNNYRKDIEKVLKIFKEFALRIEPENWYGKYVDDKKLEKNLKRLENAKLAETASAALWAQFQHKPSSVSQILRVFDALQQCNNDRVIMNLLKTIRDGMNNLVLDEPDLNRFSDYLTKTIMSNYHLDSHSGKIRLAIIAIDALAELKTNRNYDKLLGYFLDCCKKSEVCNTFGRPEHLLSYLSYIHKEKLVDTIWQELESTDDQYEHRKLNELLEKIGEVKIFE